MKSGLKRWQLLELISYFLELSQWSGDGTVLFDAHMPNIKTGKLRQVDIGVLKDNAQQLRFVEVQHRSRRITDEFIDRAIGKRSQLGAAKVTIVATAGFTKGAP